MYHGEGTKWKDVNHDVPSTDPDNVGVDLDADAVTFHEG
jgi:hypothetical protein